MAERDDIGPRLRAAYEAAPETADPSPVLWERTRRSLEARGLIQSRAPRWRGIAAVAAVAGAAFLGGYLVGQGNRSTRFWTEADPSRPGPEDPVAAAERVQGVGTTYAWALEELLRGLKTATAEEVATSRAVLLALAEAQSKPTRMLLSGHVVAGPAPATEGGEPQGGEYRNDATIWF